MTEKQARAQGLTFTGHYESWFHKDKVKNIAQAIRKLYKCRVVMAESSGGYSLFADDKYSAVQVLESVKRVLANEQRDREEIQKRYTEEMQLLEGRMARANETLKQVYANYPELEEMTEIPDVYAYLRANNKDF